MTREQRRLAAIVAADVVGYSRLMGRDESGTVARLRANRENRLTPRREVTRLKAERDILKKAAAYFAKGSHGTC